MRSPSFLHSRRFQEAEGISLISKLTLMFIGAAIGLALITLLREDKINITEVLVMSLVIAIIGTLISLLISRRGEQHVWK